MTVSNKPVKTVKAAARRLIQLYGPGGRYWIKESLERELAPEVYAHCLLGGAEHLKKQDVITPQLEVELNAAVAKAIKPRFNRYEDEAEDVIVNFNDARSRTFNDILKVLRKVAGCPVVNKRKEVENG